MQYLISRRAFSSLLPPLPHGQHPLTVALDLEGTLCCTMRSDDDNARALKQDMPRPPDADNVPLGAPDFRGYVKPLSIWLRPGLTEFLIKLHRCFPQQLEVVLFTYAREEFASSVLNNNIIVDLPFPVSSVFTHQLFRQHNSFQPHSSPARFKDLAALNRPLSHVILVDDSPSNYHYHRENGVPITTYAGEVSLRSNSLSLSCLSPS